MRVVALPEVSTKVPGRGRTMMVRMRRKAEATEEVGA